MNSSDEKWYPGKARIISNKFTFIDYPFTFKKDRFENDYNEIYPNELEFKKENPYKSLFLDAWIEVYDKGFLTKLLRLLQLVIFY